MKKEKGEVKTRGFGNFQFSCWVILLGVTSFTDIRNTRLFGTNKFDTNLCNLLSLWHLQNFQQMYPGFDEQVVENIRS